LSPHLILFFKEPFQGGLGFIGNLTGRYKKKEIGRNKKEGYTKPFTNASGSKGEKGIKGEKCTYCQIIHILSHTIK